MFESDFVQFTLTPILAIIGAVFGLIGTGIGVFTPRQVPAHGESKADGMQDLVCAIVVDVLRVVNPECKGLYPLG
jgi:hypothetical protein